MKTFEVRMRRFDRREGTSNWHVTKINATGTATAISRAVREYMRGLTRKEKRDAGRLLEVKVTMLVELQEAPPEVYAAVDRLIAGGRA